MNDNAPSRSLLPGLILTLIGAGLSALVLAANTGGPPALEALAWRLGLAAGPLLLGIGQVALLTGLWLLWRARRRPE